MVESRFAQWHFQCAQKNTGMMAYPFANAGLFLSLSPLTLDPCRACFPLAKQGKRAHLHEAGWQGFADRSEGDAESAGTPCQPLVGLELCWSNVTILWEFEPATRFYEQIRNHSYQSLATEMNRDSAGQGEGHADERMGRHAADLSWQLHDHLLSQNASRCSTNFACLGCPLSGPPSGTSIRALPW